MTGFSYRGCAISDNDILYIRELIVAHPGASRRTLSTKVCEAWERRHSDAALHE